MAKQKVCQRYVYKIHSSLLRNSNWDLNFTLDEAIRQHIISLGDSQALRFIDEITESPDSDKKAKEIREQIIEAKRLKSNKKNKELIKNLYEQLYTVRLCEHYMSLIIDSNKDYDRACKGFTINGITYRRLLGTTNGVKKSTIVFVNEEIYEPLKEKLDAGRDKSVPMVPAKLEAYQALICSGSIPVSMPRGIIIVPDCITKFKYPVIKLSDSDSGEPKCEYIENYDIELDASDGFGFMLPSISRRWSNELDCGDDYLSGVNTRGLPWTKGMLFTFDFIEFAEKVAGTYMVTDVWGDVRDVRDAEVILTESMMKLCNSYKSWEEYYENIKKYNYSFAIAKTAPHELDEVRATNYQFLQSYKLNDEQIHELIDPYLDELEDSLGLNYRKSLLLLRGSNITEESIIKSPNDFTKALMIEPELINDPYVRNSLYSLLKKKINDAKLGVINIHANFAILGGDLYSLAQSMFGLEVTGLLKANECYHKFWLDRDVEEIAVFRAPMTSHNNIRKMNVVNDSEINHWYQYVPTCMFINSWDTTMSALNGCDFDGDIAYTTDNRILIDNWRDLPSIECIQRAAEKKVCDEKDFIKGNKLSFGDTIGSITNVVTSMICLQSLFDKGSEEYKTLDYRILCGQHYQQNSIDRAKGIISEPMPLSWRSGKGCKISEDDNTETIKQKKFNKKIAADKKPYFMRYRYATLNKEYKQFLDKAHMLYLVEDFDKSQNEILNEDLILTEKEQEYKDWFYNYIPIVDSPCVVNNICHFVESRFDKVRLKRKTEFDYTILKTDKKYPKTLYRYVKNIYTIFKREQVKLNSITKGNSKSINPTKDASIENKRLYNYMRYMFRTQAINEEDLTNILLDICYKENKSKDIVWMVCGNQIIENLLNKHNRILQYPKRCEDGDITYMGLKYKMETITLNNISESEEIEYED